MRIRRATVAAFIAAPLTLAVVACDTDEQAVEEAPPAAEEQAEPLDRDPASEAEVTELETLTPLGSDDVGRWVEVEGTVVGEPVDQGFWVLTDDDTAIFVRSDRPAQPGTDTQDMDYLGEIRTAEEQESSDWLERANLEAEDGYADWDVQNELYIDATATPPAEAPTGGVQGAQQP